MPILYSGDHSVTFISYNGTDQLYKKNTWADFHLVPLTRPSVNPSSPKYTLVPIPGTDKILDVTDYMPGGLTFSRSTGQWEFYVDHDKWTSWIDCREAIEEYINGKRLYCILEDDPFTIYLGTFTASTWEDGQAYSQVTINYEIDHETITDSNRLFFDIYLGNYHDELNTMLFENRKSISYRSNTQAWGSVFSNTNVDSEYFEPEYISGEYTLVIYIYDLEGRDIRFLRVPIEGTSETLPITAKKGFNFVNTHVSISRVAPLIPATGKRYVSLRIMDATNDDKTGYSSFDCSCFIVPYKGGDS